jgi:uncharacterized protein (DUF2235 family)
MPFEASTSPRQLVLLCDGTNNNLTGRLKDTNVVKLSELLAHSPDAERLVYYDPGVGNSGELPGATNWDKLRRSLNRVSGLAFGRGVYENMAESYLFLMRHYRPGDEVFIFGFSRGAFTARSVAGLVNLFGILQPHMEGMLPTLLHVYFADRTDKKTSNRTHKEAVNEVAEQISGQFTTPATRGVDLQFIGVWDTVSSVGMWPFNSKITALPTPDHKRFVHIRQALALDEHRSQFKPRLYAGNNGPFKTVSGRDGSLMQLWFPGSHCDVGGGYEVEACALSDAAFGWLVAEAVRCGLRLAVDGSPLTQPAAIEARLHQVHKAAQPDRATRIHSELKSTALWAVTGMCVRDTNRVVMDAGASVNVSAQGHEQDPRTSGHPALTDAEHGAWFAAQTPWLVWCALVFGLALLLPIGQLLAGAPHTDGLLGDLRVAAASVPDYLRALATFQWWQLTGWWSPDWPTVATRFPCARWALVWDLPFVAAYAVVLSWYAALSFSRLAGVRHAGDAARPWLNRLGWSLTALVFADVGENILTWFAITLGLNQVVTLATLLHLAAAVCSVVKFVGLAGTVALVVAGVFGGRR